MTIENNKGSKMQSAEHSTDSPDCKFMRGILANRNMEEASRSFKAISHPLRLNILCVLGTGKMSVQDILEAVGTSQSNVSQHLRLLRDKGIVESEKDANRVFYSVKNETIKQLLGSIES
ncbi:MAG: metalloregulator ArsR/SmtB family transcription factor [Cocleimonas sp.]